MGSQRRARRVVELCALAALLTSCGGADFPSTVAGPSTTIASTPADVRSSHQPTPARRARSAASSPTIAARGDQTTVAPPAQAPHSFALASYIPGPAVLGPEWTDDGDPGTSLDLTDPPTACLAYAPVFRNRVAGALHEFGYLETPDGEYERGHMNIAVIRATSAAVVSMELAAVTDPTFARCAEASAIRHFDETYTGTIDTTTAHTVQLDLATPNVVWRVNVDWHGSEPTEHVMQMDVVYLASRDVLAKVRVASCGCNAPVDAGPVLPGELPLLRSIAVLLSRS